MQKTRLTFLFFFTAILAGFSQEANNEVPSGYKYGNDYEFTLAGITDQYAAALSWIHLHGIGKNKKFKIGYGLRYSGYTSKNQYYTTAPALLTSKQEGPQVLFSETFWENIDTFQVSTAQFHMVNASINLEYSFTKRFDFGFNIDAIGFSFGRKESGTVISSIKPATLNTVQQANPTTLNLLLVSDNDIGSLNSELYIRWWLNDKIGIKAGFSFMFTEYTTTNKLLFDNDRFRNKTLMGMLGITYSPFNNRS